MSQNPDAVIAAKPPSPTANTGRLGILPGIGVAPPDVIAPLQPRHTDREYLPDLDVPGRLPDDNPRLIRRPVIPTEDTEKLLNALIGECHFIMSEVAFRCIVQSCGVEDRLAFMHSAMSCAETGAAVAKAVAKLRHAPINEEAMIAKALARAEARRQEKMAESKKQ